MSRPQTIRPLEQPARTTRPLTLISPASREVVYLEHGASLNVITAALEAWGLKVRQDRETGDVGRQASAPAEVSWDTTRPGRPATGRLDNELSPMWLPIREPVAENGPVAAFAWFGRVA